MSNLEQYKNIFFESFGNENLDLENLKYQDIMEWDSVGHMNLMSSLEEIFNIELDIDDIIDFSSFEKGKEILKKYNIVINE
jgi:acyl carrier protein